MIPFVLDDTLFSKLTEEAKKSPRLRMHYDLRETADDESMRMLNAIEPESVIPIHRHPMTSEEIVVLKGSVEEILYDENGVETERVRLTAGSPVTACHVSRNVYHTCRSLESGSVIMEFKNTKYDPVGTEEYL